MSYVHINPDWRPAPRRPNLGPPVFLTVEWEPEPDQEFKLSPVDRRAIRRGQKVLIKTR